MRRPSTAETSPVYHRRPFKPICPRAQSHDPGPRQIIIQPDLLSPWTAADNSSWAVRRQSVRGLTTSLQQLAQLGIRRVVVEVCETRPISSRSSLVFVLSSRSKRHVECETWTGWIWGRKGERRRYENNGNRGWFRRRDRMIILGRG